MHNFVRECQSHWRKNFLPNIRYVATIPCESVRHKSNTFHTILALCTWLYRSHGRKPVSMKQTKHSRKSEAQNLCSKCPPFTRTHAFKRLRQCAIVAVMWSSSLYSLSRRFSTSFTSWTCKRYTLSWRIPQMLYSTGFKSGKLGGHVLWRDKIWRLSLSLSLFLSAALWQYYVHGERHDFSDVNITSPGKGSKQE